MRVAQTLTGAVEGKEGTEQDEDAALALKEVFVILPLIPISLDEAKPLAICVA